MPKAERKKLSLSERVLIILSEAGRTFENPYRTAWERMNLDESVTSRNLRTTVDRLKRSGRLERVERGDRVVYQLSDGARTQIRRYTFSKKRWDGKWRLVAFDIPEQRRRARDVLRERLYEFGFRQFQESVWIAPFDVLEEIRELRQEYQVSRYVKLLTVEVIEDHDRLMRRFGLPAKKEPVSEDDTKEIRP
jgi:CRISPR-associated endonuclease Cas2